MSMSKLQAYSPCKVFTILKVQQLLHSVCLSTKSKRLAYRRLHPVTVLPFGSPRTLKSKTAHSSFIQRSPHPDSAPHLVWSSSMLWAIFWADTTSIVCSQDREQKYMGHNFDTVQFPACFKFPFIAGDCGAWCRQEHILLSQNPQSDMDVYCA